MYQQIVMGVVDIYIYIYLRDRRINGYLKWEVDIKICDERGGYTDIWKEM